MYPVQTLGKSASRRGSSGSYHLRRKIRQAEGWPWEVCQGQGSSGAYRHWAAQWQWRACPGTTCSCTFLPVLDKNVSVPSFSPSGEWLVVCAVLIPGHSVHTDSVLAFRASLWSLPWLSYSFETVMWAEMEYFILVTCCCSSVELANYPKVFDVLEVFCLIHPCYWLWRN